MEHCNFSVSTICKTNDHHRRMSNSVDSDVFHSARWEPVLRFALGEPNVRCIQVFGPFCVQIVTTLDGHADDIIGLRLSDQGEKLAEQLATTWFHETSKDLAKLESPWLVRGPEGFSSTGHDGIHDFHCRYWLRGSRVERPRIPRTGRGRLHPK